MAGPRRYAPLVDRGTALSIHDDEFEWRTYVRTWEVATDPYHHAWQAKMILKNDQLNGRTEGKGHYPEHVRHCSICQEEWAKEAQHAYVQQTLMEIIER